MSSCEMVPDHDYFVLSSVLFKAQEKKLVLIYFNSLDKKINKVLSVQI